MLPASITKLVGLTKLNLEDNQLTALPESIGDPQLTGLKELGLRGNKKRVLTPAMKKFAASRR